MMDALSRSVSSRVLSLALPLSQDRSWRINLEGDSSLSLSIIGLV